MMNDHKQERTVVATPVQKPIYAGRYVKIEVTAEEEEDKLWGLIAENGWSGRTIGENIFLFTEEQAETIRQAGINFRPLD